MVLQEGGERGVIQAAIEGLDTPFVVLHKLYVHGHVWNEAIKDFSDSWAWAGDGLLEVGEEELMENQ